MKITFNKKSSFLFGKKIFNKFTVFLIVLITILSSFINRNYFFNLNHTEKREIKNGIPGLKVAEGLEVTLFASEPMMTNPTNMDIDAKGRVWICEGFNYRNATNLSNPYRPKGDRILIMEDTNGDGKADTSKVFYQGEDINAALGISVLGNKVIVSCSPNVFVFTDEDGDDKADKKEILFSGLGGYQHDHAVHAFLFGPDGKLYFNFGNEGSTKEGLDKNGKPLVDDLGRSITGKDKYYKQGMVFRCNTDGSGLEILGHNFRNNYEVAIDAFGTLWQSDNDDDGNKGVRINYVMEHGNFGYTDEMTGAGWQSRRTNMEPEIPRRHWHQNDPGVVPNLLQTGAGSPTGMVIYEGDLLPEKYRNQIIHCDAGPNIVRAYPVTKDGAGYKATIENIIDGSAGDNWFRPSDVAVAPDGSIFISDWYDPGVGGHQMGDTARGRVYRIAPTGNKYKKTNLDFDSPKGLVEALKNPNLSVRYLAWTKLHGMQKKAEPALLEMYNSSNERYRARALWLLANIKGSGEKYVNKALLDKNDDIKITGIRLAKELNINIISSLSKLSTDPSAQVRREVALALYHSKDTKAPEIWNSLTNGYDGKDRWYLEALGIAADNQWDNFFEKYLTAQGEKWNTPAGHDIVWRSRSKETVAKLTKMISSANPQDRLRYFRAFDFQNDPNKNNALISLLKTDQKDIALLALKSIDVKQSKNSPEIAASLPSVLASVKNTADYLDLVRKYELKNENKQLIEMALSMPDSTLGKEAAEMYLRLNGVQEFKNLVNGNNKQNAVAALKVFGSSDDDMVKDELVSIALDKKRDLDFRKQAIKKFAGWKGEEKLFKLVKEGKIPQELEATTAGVLLGTWHTDIRNELGQYLKVATPDGKKLPSVAEMVNMKGDVVNGEKVLNTYCFACHQVNGKGINFGPTLSEIGDKLAKEGLYKAVMYPDAGISFGFEGYSIKLKNRTEYQGIIVSKTENEIELKLPGGSVQKFKRSEIVSQVEMTSSLMPQFPLSKTDLVDLIEYLNTLKKK